ncbi:MAG: 2-C-methyl-D-erythritol 4-phosphate cytidylyltransferase [Actinobacteria bacterium]|nr:2-C-methyl-D-erythritol 4-phosphate cytidylyltransferase [Actinomycetota bacterium]
MGTHGSDAYPAGGDAYPAGGARSAPGKAEHLALIVAAGGYGLRLGVGSPKQYLPLLGIPMVQRTLAALDDCPLVTCMVVVVNPADVRYCSAEIVAERFEKVVAVVGGGAERAFSVRNGLRALAERGGAELVGVHDGARPLVGCAEVEAAVTRLRGDLSLAGVVVGLPSTDTVKMVDEAGLVTATPDRRRVWRAFTPQIFRWDVFVQAYGQADEVLAAATDDASLVEGLGGRVAMVEGSPENLKVTTPTDLRVAEHILAERRR